MVNIWDNITLRKAILDLLHDDELSHICALSWGHKLLLLRDFEQRKRLWAERAFEEWRRYEWERRPLRRSNADRSEGGRLAEKHVLERHAELNNNETRLAAEDALTEQQKRGELRNHTRKRSPVEHRNADFCPDCGSRPANQQDVTILENEIQRQTFLLFKLQAALNMMVRNGPEHLLQYLQQMGYDTTDPTFEGHFTANESVSVVTMWVGAVSRAVLPGVDARASPSVACPGFHGRTFPLVGVQHRTSRLHFTKLSALRSHSRRLVIHACHRFDPFFFSLLANLPSAVSHLHGRIIFPCPWLPLWAASCCLRKSHPLHARTSATKVDVVPSGPPSCVLPAPWKTSLAHRSLQASIFSSSRNAFNLP